MGIGFELGLGGEGPSRVDEIVKYALEQGLEASVLGRSQIVGDREQAQIGKGLTNALKTTFKLGGSRGNR